VSGSGVRDFAMVLNSACSSPIPAAFKKRREAPAMFLLRIRPKREQGRL